MNFKRFLGVILGIFGIFYSYFYSYLEYENILIFFTKMLSVEYLFQHWTALVYLGYIVAAYFGRRYLMATLSGVVFFPLLLNDFMYKCLVIFDKIDLLYILSMLGFVYPLLFRKGWENPKTNGK